MSLQRQLAIATRGYRGDIGAKYYINESIMLSEEMANTAGAGNVAGIGIGPDGEPGVKKNKKKKKLDEGL